MLKLQRGSEVVQAAALRLGEAGWQHLSLPSSRARQRTVTSGAASLGGGGRGLACGSSSDGTSESIGIDLLNVRLQRRHAVDRREQEEEEVRSRLAMHSALHRESHSTP